MPTERKSLRQKMREAEDEARQNVKAILYPLPDLKGPGGNAFNLLGQADRLMRDKNVPETTRDTFRRVATRGDYEHLLNTLQEWFTIAVADVTYVPLNDSIDIRSLIPSESEVEVDEQEDPDNGEYTSLDAEIDSALEDYAAIAERDRKIAEVQDRINREVRQELGLDDDDVVIVQVKKKGDK